MKKLFALITTMALLTALFPIEIVPVHANLGDLILDKEYVNMNFEAATKPDSNTITTPNLAANKPTGWDTLTWTSTGSAYSIYGGSDKTSSHPWDISTSSTVINQNTSYYIGAGNKPDNQITLSLPLSVGDAGILCLDMRLSLPGANSSNRDSMNLVFENADGTVIFFLEAPGNNVFTSVKVREGTSTDKGIYSSLTYQKTTDWKYLRTILNFKESTLSLYLGNDLNTLSPLITNTPTVNLYNISSGLKKIRTSNKGGICFDDLRMYSLTEDVKPIASNLSVSGNNYVGGSLTASYTFKDIQYAELDSTAVWESADNLEFTDNVQTIQGPENVTAATGSSYTLKSDDADKYIRFSVTPRSNNPDPTANEGRTISAIYDEPIRLPASVPIVSLTSPEDGLKIYHGISVALSATAVSDFHNITQVEFYAKNKDGTEPDISIGTAMTAPYTVNWSDAPVGEYNLFARATDDNPEGAGSAESAPVSLTVLPPVVVEASDYYKISPSDPNVPSWQKVSLEETATSGTYRLINKDNDNTLDLSDSSSWYEFSLVSISNDTEWSLKPSDKSTYKYSMVVPGSVDGKPVTEITGEAFRDTHNSASRYLVVSENIKTIGGGAFRRTSFIGIRLPHSLETIGDMSFYENGSLSSINLEDTSLTNTGTGAFRSSGLTEITFPATLKNLGTATLSGSTKLKAVTFLGPLEKSNSPLGTNDNAVSALGGTIALEKIIFNGYIAPGYNTSTGATTATHLSGFNSAGLDYQVAVYYPKGGLGYDTDEFMSGFREGTTFIEVPKVEAQLEGKPNMGAELQGSFTYINAIENEEESIGYWERCNTPYFLAGDIIEKISDGESLTSSQTAHYTIKPEDSGKYIRFCVEIPLLDVTMTENARLYMSSPTQRIDYFEVKLEINGNAAGSEFYIDEGISSYGAAARVINSTSDAKEFYLVAAWYGKEYDTLGNDYGYNVIVDLYIDKITVPAGTESENGINDNVWMGRTKTPSDIEELQNLALKIFAFEDMENVKPLSKEKTFSGIYDSMIEVSNSNPGGLYTKEQFEFVRTKIAAQEEPWKSAFDKLIVDANAWIDEEPSPVSHWYVPGYYTNAQGHKDKRKVMLDDLKSAYACGLAYQFTGKPKYADQTIRILNAWASATRTIGSEDSVLVGAYVGNGFPMAAELVKDYKGWLPADKGYFDSWLKSVYRGFLKGTAVSNAGDWNIFARLAIDAYLNNPESMQSDITQLKGRIESNINDVGELPHENGRGSAGVWYTYFALAPMTAASQIIYNTTGENLFNYTSPSEKSLKPALDKHLGYCKNVSTWPYGSAYIGGNASTSWNFFLYEAMADIYNDTTYLEYVESHRPLNGPFLDGGYHHMAWFYPTLMSGSVNIIN